MAFEAVLVDLDGTVWDSFGWYAKILAGLSGQHEALHADELAAGGNLFQLIRRAGVDRNHFLRGCRDCVAELTLFPGVEETIRHMFDADVALGVVTSLPGTLARETCKAKEIFQFFSGFEAARRGRRPKPDPQGILEALRAMEVNPSPAVCYVGDLAADAGAAKNAGISFVWARYGYGALTDEPRIAEIDCFDELMKV